MFEMLNLYLIRIIAFEFFTCNFSVDAFYIPTFYIPNCVSLYLLPLLLHGIGNLLAYVAAPFVIRVCGFLRVRGRAGKA